MPQNDFQRYNNASMIFYLFIASICSREKHSFTKYSEKDNIPYINGISHKVTMYKKNSPIFTSRGLGG